MKVVRFCRIFTISEEKFFKMVLYIDFGLFSLVSIIGAITSFKILSPGPFIFATITSILMALLSLIVLIYHKINKEYGIIDGCYIWSRTISYFMLSIFLVWQVVLIIVDDQFKSETNSTAIKIGLIAAALLFIGIFALNVNWSFTMRQIVLDSLNEENLMVEDHSEEARPDSINDAIASRDETTVGQEHKINPKKEYESQVIDVVKI